MHSVVKPIANVSIGFDSNLLKRNGKKQGLKEQLSPHNCQLSKLILKTLQCALTQSIEICSPISNS